VWVDLPAHVDVQRLFEQTRRRGVLVSPGSLYQPLASGRNGIRLCVAAEPEERLAEAFAILGRELEEVLRSPPPAPAEQEYQSMH
jgi:DNA-binding transcriptional MocR family regulator